MSSRQFTPFGGSGEIFTLDDINEYDDLPPLAEIDSPDVYEIRTGNFATDYLVPIQDGSTDFNEWYSLVDGQIILDIPDIAVNQYPATETDADDGQTATTWFDQIDPTEDIDLNDDPTFKDDAIDNAYPGLEFDGSQWGEVAWNGGDVSAILDGQAVTFVMTLEFSDSDRYDVLDAPSGQGSWFWRASISENSTGEMTFPHSRDVDGNRFEVTTQDANLNDGEPHRIAMAIESWSGTMEPSDIKIGVDGSYVSTTTNESAGLSNIADDITEMKLFGQSGGNRFVGAGDLDVARYDVVLSEDELQDDYDRQAWS